MRVIWTSWAHVWRLHSLFLGTGYDIADRSLAKEKAARQTAKQSLQTSDEAWVNLARDLESIQASLTATASKLASKSSALDRAVI
jgi:hypothetical protein